MNPRLPENRRGFFPNNNDQTPTKSARSRCVRRSDIFEQQWCDHCYTVGYRASSVGSQMFSRFGNVSDTGHLFPRIARRRCEFQGRSAFHADHRIGRKCELPETPCGRPCGCSHLRNRRRNDQRQYPRPSSPFERLEGQMGDWRNESFIHVLCERLLQLIGFHRKLSTAPVSCGDKR